MEKGFCGLRCSNVSQQEYQQRTQRFAKAFGERPQDEEGHGRDQSGISWVSSTNKKAATALKEMSGLSSLRFSKGLKDYLPWRLRISRSFALGTQNLLRCILFSTTSLYLVYACLSA